MTNYKKKDLNFFKFYINKKILSFFFNIYLYK